MELLYWRLVGWVGGGWIGGIKDSIGWLHCSRGLLLCGNNGWMVGCGLVELRGGAKTHPSLLSLHSKVKKRISFYVNPGWINMLA